MCSLLKRVEGIDSRPLHGECVHPQVIRLVRLVLEMIFAFVLVLSSFVKTSRVDSGAASHWKRLVASSPFPSVSLNVKMYLPSISFFVPSFKYSLLTVSGLDLGILLAFEQAKSTHVSSDQSYSTPSDGLR